MKANGVVVRVFGAVLPLPGSHIPQMHTLFSQNLNQQIQFTSHVNKIVLEPRVLPFDSRRRVATRSVHSVHNDQYRRIVTLRYTGTDIFFA